MYPYVQQRKILKVFFSTQLNRIDALSMFNNVMDVNHYGDMANPNVLTDYYARRHTQQYRSNFLALAEVFHYTNNDKKAVDLLDKSMQVMPVDVVFDFGEIFGWMQLTTLLDNKINNQIFEEFQPKASGNLYEFVQLYFKCKSSKKGAELGNKLMNQYESI